MPKCYIRAAYVPAQLACGGIEPRQLDIGDPNANLHDMEMDVWST